jgi:hypothetical protein
MKKIEKGIVFSNDIGRILEGNNALGFSYEENGMIIPNTSFIESLRNDFEKDVNKIFEGNVTIIREDEMLYGIYSSIRDVVARWPHRFP